MNFQRILRKPLRKVSTVLCYLILFPSFHITLFNQVVYGHIGATEDLETIVADKLIHVNNQHPHADDSNAGTVDKPIRTVGRAVQLAMEYNKRGFSSTILIYPGVYREQIVVDSPNRTTDPPIIFRAKEPGTAIISGSDIWADWREEDTTGVYSHNWPYKWELMPYPPGWKQVVELADIVRRREMVFIDGAPMKQVLSQGDLKPGTFYVSEEKSTIFISLPSGLSMSTVKIEVAVRSGIMSIRNKNNVVLRGLRFQHDATGVQGAAVRVSNARNILIEECIFVWNNWTGLGLVSVDNITTRGNIMNSNGGAGFSAYSIRNILSQDDETSHNNWRGLQGNFLSWAVAGIKHMRVHNGIYRRDKTVHNDARGFWLDFDIRNVIVESLKSSENLVDGVLVEAAQGPVTVRNSKIHHNKRWGIWSTNSEQLTLEGNHIFDNTEAQIKINGDEERTVEDFESRQKLLLKVRNWILKENIIASNDSFLLDIIGWKHFLTGLLSDHNVWCRFKSQYVIKVSGRPLRLSDWQKTMHMDANSQFFESFNGRGDAFHNTCLPADSTERPQ